MQRKEGKGKNIEQNKKGKSNQRGQLSWLAALGPSSQVGELGRFLNSSLRRMVGSKVRVGGVWLPRPRPMVVTAAQRPSAPVVHGSRGGVGEVS